MIRVRLQTLPGTDRNLPAEERYMYPLLSVYIATIKYYNTGKCEKLRHDIVFSLLISIYSMAIQNPYYMLYLVMLRYKKPCECLHDGNIKESAVRGDDAEHSAKTGLCNAYEQPGMILTINGEVNAAGYSRGFPQWN